jgi:uncharacterized SAM-binding protein YcdF (DUF218 family)
MTLTADAPGEAAVTARRRRTRRRRSWVWWIAVGLLATVGLAVVYLGVTFLQVWSASRQDHAQPADRIIVLGAAQYNGRPSPVLAARLDHAADLWHRGLAPKIVVTGGKRPGDRFTEAQASATYLVSKGVPAEAIELEVSSTSSWESLAASARFLRKEGVTNVLLVSDPYHSFRIGAIAAELGLHAHVSPTPTSPVRGTAKLRAMARETAAVAIGRLIGYRRQVRLHTGVRR